MTTFTAHESAMFAYDAATIATTAAEKYDGERADNVKAILLAHAERRMQDARQFSVLATTQSSEQIHADLTEWTVEQPALVVAEPARKAPWTR